MKLRIPISLLIKFIIMFNTLQGMNHRQVCIADNNEDSTSVELCSFADNSKIGIFGATPRYTLFTKYCTTMLQHYQLALQMKRDHQNAKKGEHPTNPKDVFEKNIILALGRFIRDEPLLLEKAERDIALILEFFQRHAESQYSGFVALIDMFLKYGVEQKVLLGNLARMIDTAAKNQVTDLVHIFLPTYFTGAGELDRETAHCFLRRCARYYYDLYQQIDLPEGMQVVIVIPSLDQDGFFSDEAMRDPDVCIAQVINQNVAQRIKVQSLGGCAFINQNQDENEQVCPLFANISGMGVQSVIFECYDYRYRVQTEKIFTPYHVKADMKTYGTAKEEVQALKLLHGDLHDYLKQNIFYQDHCIIVREFNVRS